MTKEDLIKLANSKGFKGGVKVKSLVEPHQGTLKNHDENPYITYGDCRELWWTADSGLINLCIYDSGKWATIIESITKINNSYELY